jgi:hypothetical protein
MRLHDRRTCPERGCVTCRRGRRAHLAFITNPRARLTGDTRQQSDPVLWADAQTSYHDLRAALCLALGAGVDDVDPCTGHLLATR